MLAVQYLIAFTMIYLILFHFLNFEKKKKVLWLNVGIAIVLTSTDIIRQLHYGYQPIRQYDALLGFLPVIFTTVYMLSGFKKWQLWFATIVSIFLILFVNNIAISFTFGLLE